MNQNLITEEFIAEIAAKRIAQTIEGANANCEKRLAKNEAFEEAAQLVLDRAVKSNRGLIHPIDLALAEAIRGLKR